MLKTKFFMCVLSVLVSLSVLPSAQATLTSTLLAESVVESFGEQPSNRSIIVDASGVVHVAYYESTNSDLYYAKIATDGTITQTKIDETGDVGRAPHIFIDSAGVVYILYYDFTNKDIKGAKIGETLLLETFQGSGVNVSHRFSAVLDQNDVLQILSTDRTNEKILYDTFDLKSGGKFSYSFEINTLYPQLSLFGTTPSFIDTSSSQLSWSQINEGGSLASFAGEDGTPSPEVMLSSSADSSGDAAFVVDSQGQVHAFYQFSSQLYYAKRTADGIISTQLFDDTSVLIGADVSVVVDTNDTVHLAYVDDTNDLVRYATVTADGTITRLSLVETTSSTDIGYFLTLGGITLDQQGLPWFTYAIEKNNLVPIFDEDGLPVLDSDGNQETDIQFASSSLYIARLDRCGDGIVSAAETCDDKNTTDNDGCSSVCLIETPDPTGEDTTDPTGTGDTTTDPTGTGDTTTDPTGTGDTTTDPTGTGDTTTDPTGTGDTTTDPTATDPTTTDPTATDSTDATDVTDPTATDPTTEDPTATDPNSAEASGGCVLSTTSSASRGDMSLVLLFALGTFFIVSKRKAVA